MLKFKCRACSKEIMKGEKICPDCGSKDLIQIRVRVEFVHPGIIYPFSVHKTMVIGRDCFRAYGNGYKYVENQQFELIEEENCWKIKGLPATNPTFQNGLDITNKTCELKNGDKIKIGNFELEVKFVEEEITME